MYVIENAVPMPDPRGSTKYPFGEMQVGDSFVAGVAREKIYQAASYYGIRNNKKFSVRKQTDGSFRVWRTA